VAEGGVALLLSEDFQHSRRLKGVQVCNPFKLEAPLAGIFQNLP
jgi:predicted nucleic acid-binding protein